MFGMGMTEIMLILAVALVVIGPKKLPGLAKSLGRAMGEFKNATQDFKRSIDLEGDLQDVKKSFDGLQDIPTYDPDQDAYKGVDTAETTAAEPGKAEQGSDIKDAAEFSAGLDADQQTSTGAKRHG